MKQIYLAAILVAWVSVASGEFSGNVALEAFIFPDDPQFDQQFGDNLTLSFKPRWVSEWNDGDDSMSAEVFLRADNKDNERNHADIRELLWLHLDGDNEWRVGLNTMFWGVAESQHLVDVINQIDQVEGIDGEDKLGQPMIHLKRYQDWGVLDFLVLPGFRERTFQAIEGRPRTPLLVDGDTVTYQSSDKNNHVDYAFRYSHTIDDLDFGFSWFKGTNREPQLTPDLDNSGLPILIPHYVQMTQLGLDLQLIDEDWTWKLEVIHRDTEQNNFEALTAGFEYSFYGVFETDIDLGTLVEYSHDNRPEDQRGVFDRDLFFGARLAFNDIQSTELLVGFVADTDKQSRSFRLEGNRRIGDSWKGTIEVQMFSNIDESDPLIAFEKDDYLLVELARFF